MRTAMLEEWENWIEKSGEKVLKIIIMQRHKNNLQHLINDEAFPIQIGIEWSIE